MVQSKPPKAPADDESCASASKSVLLDQCQALRAIPHVECTHFYQFVLLRPKKPPATTDIVPDPWTGPVATFPGSYALKDGDFKARIIDKSRQITQGIHDRFPSLQPAVATQPGVAKTAVRETGKGAELRKKELDRVGQTLKENYLVNRFRGATLQKVQMVMSSGKGGLLPDFDTSIDLTAVLEPMLAAIKDAATLAAEANPTAIWAVGLDYRQCWESRGYVRGRLVRSLPLTPGEQVEIVIKSWDKRLQRKSAVDSIEQNLSNEIVGDEKWMIASKMNYSDQTNAGVNPSAGAQAGVGIPIKVVTANLGGNLGLAGNLSKAISQASSVGTDYIQSSMIKSAESIKSVRTNTVELSQETGTESSAKQVIANTNRCHTLTYHYFEVLEDFSVTTRLSNLGLYLLLPLPLPDITPEWVLCHECYLRKILPCDTFYAGLAAAKQLLTWQAADSVAPGGAWWSAGQTADASGGDADSTGLNAAVGDVLGHWQAIKEASLRTRPNAVGPDWGNVAAGMQKGLQGAAAMADGVKNGDPNQIKAGFTQAADGFKETATSLSPF